MTVPPSVPEQELVRLLREPVLSVVSTEFEYPVEHGIPCAERRDLRVLVGCPGNLAVSRVGVAVVERRLVAAGGVVI